MLSRFVEAVRRNPYPLYGVLRRVAPVVRLRQGIWAVFDHDGVRGALTDPDQFSSRAAPPGDTPLEWLIFMDPPRHTQLRALIARTFTPRAVASLEPRIAAITNQLLDDVAPRGEFDLVRDFAERLPVLVILEMLGMPLADEEQARRWGDAIIGLGDTIAGGERGRRAAEAFRAARLEMRPYLDALLAARRATPADDLLTRLVQAEVEGVRLTDEEILSFFELLLLAGTETTTNLIANTMLCLFEHPAQRRLLAAEPGRLPAAIEEVVRYRCPVQMVFRATRQEVRLSGRTIPANQLVLLMVGSANRDPRHFPDPHRFDITRAAQPHVGFGHGLHFCIGAALARLEARIAVGALLSRLPGLARRDGSPWPHVRGINVHGPSSLPVKFSA